MVAKVRSGSTWVSSDDPAFHVYRRNDANTAWTEVPIAKVWATNPATGQMAWMEVFNKYQVAPTGVMGTNASVSGGKLQWQAAASATDYQVVERVGTSSDINRWYPGKDQWTPQLYQDIIAQKGDTNYHYTVIARRLSAGANPVYSAESAKATLSTGHTATPRVGTNQVVTVQPYKTDTWSSDNLWSQGSGNVGQGYASLKARNAHGAVSYSTAYTQLATKLNTTFVDPADNKTKTVPVVDHITLSDAVITRVYRGTAGTGNPRVEGHAWKSDFRTAARPRDTDFPTSNGNFTAPDESDAKENFRFLNPDNTAENMLLVWARTWVKATRTHDGILIFRTDDGGNATAGYSGYCSFRGNTYTTDWQLTLTVSWNFNFPEALAATWTPGG